MLNDVIFIWFTVKNKFPVATMKNLHSDPLGLGPVRYMTTSGQWGGRLRYSPISVHELHAESACTTSVQEGGLFRYSFWTISVHNEK